jgi:hypothetical protein
MSRSVALAHLKVEVNSLDRPMTVGPGWVLPLVARAIDRVMLRKEAAYLMGIDQAQLSRQLAGDGHLSTLRLGCLPLPFWSAFTEEIRLHFGTVSRAEIRAQAEAHIERARQLMALAGGD